MLSLTKILHVLAVGLWFGSATFFTFVGLSLSDTFEKITAKPAQDRPYWLPLPSQLDKSRPSDKFPEPLSKEQGGRIFGTAVGPMFRPYYILQVVCGGLALLTALAWPGGGVQRARVIVLLLALVGAAAGWRLEGEVEARRDTRSKLSDAVLEMESAAPSPEQVRAAETARTDFGTWHTYSLLVNCATLALVTVAMAMGAFLPATLQTATQSRETASVLADPQRLT
jgi:hypothetical protein